RMTVRIPVCEHHSRYWSRRSGTLTGFFLFVLTFGGGACLYGLDQPPGPRDDIATGWLCGTSLVLFFCWLVFAAIYIGLGVRPTEITQQYIRLTNVHEDFVAALEADRDRDADERDLRVRYGDVRDDYDDELQRPAPRSRVQDDYDDDRRAPA